MSKAAVISGGGSWGGDTIGQLLATRTNYDLVVGTSTGACMAPLVALGDYDRLSHSYSTLTNDNVFNVKPFKDDMKPRIGSWLKRLAQGKLTLGETYALLDTIREQFTELDYERLKRSKKEVIVTYTSISEPPHLRYKRFSECLNRDEFIFYMWASACIPIISSIPLDGGIQLTDGGLVESLPIDYALSNFDCTEIDCYTHEVQGDFFYEEVTNIFNFAGRVIEIMRQENKRSELRIAQLLSEKAGVNINYRHMTHKPDIHYAQFNIAGMERMITTAYNATLTR